MPPCNKECKVKVYEARNIKFTNKFPVNGGANCNKTLKGDQKLVDFVKRSVESKTTPIEGHLCAEGCTCDPVGTPKWGNWRKYKFKMTVVDGNCKFPIAGNYEKRSGVSEGVCVEPEDSEDDYGEVPIAYAGSGRRARKTQRTA
jgi:hypothetical protein